LGLPSAFPVRSDHLDAGVSHLLIEELRVVGLVANEAFGERAYEVGGDGFSGEADLRRRSRRCEYGDRRAMAVCHCHELRTFAPLGLSHTEPPFFATTKVPSMKHSERSSFPRSRKCLPSASRASRIAPEWTHCWNRRWHVWYGGNLSGRSCHGAPVRSIQSTPLNTSRASRGGRPVSFPSGGSRNGWTTAHCSSVSSSRLGMIHSSTQWPANCSPDCGLTVDLFRDSF
jgi:hypothetical protein